MVDKVFNPFESEEITPPYSEEWEARRRVASALKGLTEVLLTSTPPLDQLHHLAESLEQRTEELGACPRLYGREAFRAEGTHGTFGQVGHEINPLSGLSNPIAPPVNTWIEGDKALGSVTVGWSYEGPPGTVHGGIVAAIFDHFLGMAQSLGKQPGMTGRLTTRYHQRTPINVPLKLEAHLVKVEGRKTVMRGEMYAGNTLTASCEALFVQPRGGLKNLQTLREEPR